MDDTYLKPCPLCGGGSYWKKIPGGAVVGCKLCRVKITNMVIRENRDWALGKAVERWNNRTKDARIKELEALLGDCREYIVYHSVPSHDDASKRAEDELLAGINDALRKGGPDDK